MLPTVGASGLGSAATLRSFPSCRNALTPRLTARASRGLECGRIASILGLAGPTHSAIPFTMLTS